MLKTIDRLEQLLQHWEGFCFISFVVANLEKALKGESKTPLAGPVIHWQEFRNYLLNTEVDTKVPPKFPEERFQKPYSLSDSFGGFFHVPLMLASWHFSSRRVYQLTSDLHTLLNATSLRGIRWGDVELPFNAFAVTLDTPLFSSDGVAYDCILVARVGGMLEGESVLLFQVIPTQLEYFPIVSRYEKERMIISIQRKLWEKVSRQLIHLNSHRDFSELHIRSPFAVIEERIADALVTDSLSNLRSRAWGHDQSPASPDAEALFNQVVRIVIGLCLYLKSLPGNSKHLSSWQKLSRSSQPDSRVITNSAEICSVSSIYTLSKEEGDELREMQKGARINAGGWEVRAHFREGHWRRNRGTDALAPKTIWVRPTIVRRDRLLPGQIPGGTQKVLS